MKRLTASNIVRAIDRLPKDREYDYVYGPTTTKAIIKHIHMPEGPIEVYRYDPNKGEGPSDATVANCTTQMIWRIANAFNPGNPVNFDRVLGASYNTRSTLEALMAHTPQFYYCYPGRNEVINETSKIKKGHKHLLWLPDEPHEAGIMEEAKTDFVISEGLIQDVAYESLNIPDTLVDAEIDADIARRHAQIQVALMEIGNHFGYKNWIAKNDQGIQYQDKRIGDFEGVIPRLEGLKQLSAYSEAIKAAMYIDCIWFKNDKFIPAVMEVEHSTGITSGLTRMKGLRDEIPAFQTRYVIVASDKEREKIQREANRPQFKELNTYYFPYSSVEELYYLCDRRNIKGVTQEFIDSFMEPMVRDEQTGFYLN